MNAIQNDALGYQQITSLSSAVGLTSIPAGTISVNVQPETQNVRYRDDGTNPTSSVGMILYVGGVYEFKLAQIASMKFIEVTASAKLNVSCYGARAPS